MQLTTTVDNGSGGQLMKQGETDILAAEKEAPIQFHRFNTLGSITQLPSKT